MSDQERSKHGHRDASDELDSGDHADFEAHKHGHREKHGHRDKHSHKHDEGGTAGGSDDFEAHLFSTD